MAQHDLPPAELVARRFREELTRLGSFEAMSKEYGCFYSPDDTEDDLERARFYAELFIETFQPRDEEVILPVVAFTLGLEAERQQRQP